MLRKKFRPRQDLQCIDQHIVNPSTADGVVARYCWIKSQHFCVSIQCHYS